MIDDDVRSRAGLSEVSDTDQVVFTLLSNPDTVDLANMPALRARQLDDDGPRIEEILPMIPEEVAAPASPPPPPPTLPPVQDEERHHATPRDRYPTPPPSVAADPAADPTADPTAEHHRPVTPPPAPPPAPEDEDAKRTLLLDLRRLELQGVKMSQEYTMDSSADDMLLEIRRHSLAMDEAANVNMMRDGMRLLVTGIEMVNNRIGLLDLEGWSSDVCRDLNKHDANLSRIYRKYWKRSTSTSPELDICLSLVGSMGFHHMKRKMSKQLMSASAGSSSRGGGSGGGGGGFQRPPGASGRRRAAAVTPPSSDDEAPPP